MRFNPKLEASGSMGLGKELDRTPAGRSHIMKSHTEPFLRGSSGDGSM